MTCQSAGECSVDQSLHGRQTTQCKTDVRGPPCLRNLAEMIFAISGSSPIGANRLPRNPPVASILGRSLRTWPARQANNGRQIAGPIPLTTSCILGDWSMKASLTSRKLLMSMIACCIACAASSGPGSLGEPCAANKTVVDLSSMPIANAASRARLVQRLGSDGSRPSGERSLRAR